jgi:hypothetical protein
MHYTLHQLQVFLKVAQFNSITKASEDLNMTQPAVSIQLKNLQDQFEIPLTEVVGRQLYVTDFGKEILEMAERIINEVYAINYKTMAFKGHLSGRLKISSVSTGKYIIPYFLSGFLKDQEGIELMLDVTNKSKVITSLQNNEVDFAFVSVLPENFKVDSIELMPNKLYVVGNTDQRFKKGCMIKLYLRHCQLFLEKRVLEHALLWKNLFQRINFQSQKKWNLPLTRR